MNARSNRYSPGWATWVTLGPAQERMRARLERARRHPSRTWHDSPPLRELAPSPGTAHRTLRRLASLGVVALQTTLGCKGVTRFTFGVKRWRSTLPTRRGVARMVPPRIATPTPGQLTLFLSVGPPRAPAVQAGPSFGLAPVRFVLAHGVDSSPAIRAILAEQPAAPTVRAECVRCGAVADVRTGIYRDPDGRYQSGRCCLDHSACELRRKAVQE